MNRLGHIDEKGKIDMIDHSGKPVIEKEAEASGFLHLKPETIRLIRQNETDHGDVISLIEIAGIQAAKQTHTIIPLKNQIALTHVDVKAFVFPNGVEVKSHVRARCDSSLEVEALNAVSAALITLYEMCQTVDHSPVISDIKIQKRS